MHNEKMNELPQISVAVCQFKRKPSAKFCTNIENKTVLKSLKNPANIYGVPKTIKMDVIHAFKSEDFEEFCTPSSIKLISDLPCMHVATELAKRSIQTLKNTSVQL